MTATDYPDWTQPVALNEQVSGQLIPGNTLTVGGAVVNLDTTAAQSLTINVEAGQAAPAGHLYVVKAAWFEGTVPAAIDSVSYAAVAAYTMGTDSVLWQLPVRGSSVLLSAIGNNNDIINAWAFLSTRQVDTATVTRTQVGAGKLIATYGQVSIPANTVIGPIHVPPAMATLLSFDQNSSKIINLVSAISGDQNGNVGLQQMGTYQSTPSAQTPNIGPVLVNTPGVGLAVSASNQDSVAHNWTLAAWDAG